MMYFRFSYLLLVFFLVFASCSSDEDDMMNIVTEDCNGLVISYQNDIVPIINTTCALSGCHIEGFSNGDFTSYNGLKSKADNGRLNSRVVVNKNMPPSNSSGPKSLSAQQIIAFKCWIADGAPDN